MTRLVIDRRDVALEYETGCVVVRGPGQQARSVPLNRVEQFICMHSVQLSTQLIGQLHRRGIDFIVHNQRHDRNSFALFASEQKHVQRRCLQYDWQLWPDRRIGLSSSLCRHKLSVQYRVLQEDGAERDILQRLQTAKAAITYCQSEGKLRGIEGNVQRLVFEHWRSRLPTRFGFTQRQRRPPPDPVNSVLSLAYTLVHNDAVRQARLHGLDPQLGFYHRTAHGRQSLACDLMEPVRPHVERWVVDLFVAGVLDRRHFRTQGDACLIGKRGREGFYEAFAKVSSTWNRKLEAGARWTVRKLGHGNAAVNV